MSKERESRDSSSPPPHPCHLRRILILATLSAASALDSAPPIRTLIRRGTPVGSGPFEAGSMRIPFAKGLAVGVVSIVAVGACLAGEAVKSGLKPGEFVSPFDVDDVTGPNKGKTLCYR